MQAPLPSDLPLFRGELVRLSAFEPDTDAGAFAAWSHDARYVRLAGEGPARPSGIAEARTALEAWVKDWPGSVSFALRTLEDGRLVGLARLYDIEWTHRSAILGLSVPSCPDQGRGFGREGLGLVLRYGFRELGLHRVWLDVLEYNERALRLYRRAGFCEEGRLREHVQRDGRRWDVVLMGLLGQEYENGPSTGRTSTCGSPGPGRAS
jgi:RimJ/RimL family protein N-acetyltransferase